jgi:uncharacterized Fe-S cluster-containing radical SAM superfamily protein
LDAPDSPVIAPGSAVPEPGRYPSQPLHHLDALWIQVAGTLCNLTCTHCFVSCGPGDTRHELMAREAVRERVAEGQALGVKELYLTGGEPFLHSEIVAILGDCLEHAPTTVLTNGTLFTARRVVELARLAHASRYSLEVRVSLDGDRAEDHDRVRGPGTFARAVEGLVRLERAGLPPIVTVTRHGDEDPLLFRERTRDALRAAGLARPRLKILPLFRLGREVTRERGYSEHESLRDLPAAGFDPTRLQCGGSRAVTSRGVYVCPLLVDEPAGRLAQRLDDALGPYALRHGACFTCYVTGMTCGND